MQRLTILGANIDKQMQLRDQRFLDIDTTEKIVTRLMTWAKLFAFFIGIPLAAILVGLVLYAGKGFEELHDLAASARDSIRPLIEKARSDAETAKSMALDALRSSSEVSRTLVSAKQSMSELQRSAADRMRDVERMNGQIKESQSEVSDLRKKLRQGSDQIAGLRRQLQTIGNEKNLSSVRDAYPFSGERIGGWQDEYIDPGQKKSGDIYIALVPGGRLNEAQVSQVITSLKDANYRVFLGGVSLYGRSGRTGTSLFSINDCSLVAVSRSTCIGYFRSELRGTASKIKILVGQAQNIADDEFRYVDPGKLPPLAQELLQKSGLDILVVLGGR